MRNQTHAQRHKYDALEVGQEAVIELSSTSEPLLKIQKSVHSYGQKKGRKFVTQKCIFNERLFILRIA